MQKQLLAVDLGLTCGLALFRDNGELVWCRSHHFANITAMKAGVWGILRSCQPLTYLLGEGDRHLGAVWGKAARKQRARVRVVSASVWRADMLVPSQRRSGPEAKRWAQHIAEPLARSRVRHDTAEAVLLGLWGMRQLGWKAT